MAKVTNDDIFLAAQAVLVDKGYEKARLADVARKLGLTSAALYKHFKDKDALFSQAQQAWLNKIDEPILALAQRAPEEERQSALHDWLWQLASQRKQAFLAAPAITAFYCTQLKNSGVLLDARMEEFAASVETIMAWKTFRHRRGLTIMQTFTYYYHPFFVNTWMDNLYKTMFESAWLEIQPLIMQADEA
ncbi:TetR/AcrR family transcriptional regulator [Weissella halotolerans]|uniref:TetR family transcriptional regulator n=1 Tax=Weissella halotolerans DSM 20190 TaxID=1123500 RepID=A0A0R2G5Y1_9LACO|nr:helix-turn-helix domain-containing protein [Weissella halotolerans]KRN32180.1 TetR family transcriptional regulator [Weissella halotolerans DSM 20190]